MLLVTHAWARRRSHRTWRADHSTKSWQALTASVLRCSRDMNWSKHLRMVRRLTERERCAWANRRAGRDSTVARRHDAVDGRLMLVAVESAAFHVWTQWTKVVSLFQVVLRWHVLISHPTRCWRL
jgi:hypothetical protein